MLRLGTVPYLNALPLVDGLGEESQVQLVAAVPSQLAPMLRRGELDLALVSAVELFRNPPLHWYAGPAITSHGPVRSINLYLRRPISRLTRLGLDTSSLSAATLARICLQRFLGCERYEVVPAPPQAPLDAIDADAVLRIGDPALRTDPLDHEVLDLGAVWSEHTSLPFVYALWLAGPTLPPGQDLDLLCRARDRGLAQRDQLAGDFAAQHGMSPELCRDYLSHSIGYELGHDERAGLTLFGRLAHELELVDEASLRQPLN